MGAPPEAGVQLKLAPQSNGRLGWCSMLILNVY